MASPVTGKQPDPTLNGSSPSPSERQAQEDLWSLGSRVHLRTRQGDEISATVFAFDAPSRTLLLKEPGAHNGVATLRVVNADQVECTLAAEPAQGPVDLELPVVDMERCKRREEKALKQAEAEYDRVGVGVSKEAQAIFEALSKTLPCSWRKKTIVVLDEVLVPEPYTPASCTTDGRPLTNPKALDRVRMIVGEARARLGLL